MQDHGILFADDLIGGYLVERFLCVDSGFETYSAFHPQLEVHRIIHVLHPELYGGAPEVRENFLQAIQNLVRIRHANLLSVSDVGWEENRDILYYMTDQLSSPTLEDRMKAGNPFHEAEALPIVSAAADVLKMLAKNNLCHLRIAPQNVFLHESRGPILAEPCLHFAEIKPERSAFSAPELDGSAADVDIRADIYSLGALWFRMLTGKMPEQPSEDPRSIVPDIAEETAALIRKMLAAAPGDRPDSPDALLDALARLPGGMSLGNPDLQELTVREIDQSVTDRTRLLEEKLLSNRRKEIKIWQYAAIALGALAVILLGRDIWLTVANSLQNSQLDEQIRQIQKAETAAENRDRQLDALNQDIRLERAAIENAEKEIAILKKISPSEAGK